MSDITKDDIIYENGFPANIDHSKKVVVQITAEPMQSVVLYNCKVRGVPARSYLPYEVGHKFTTGIFEL